MTRKVLGAVAVDAVLVVVFCAIGRRSHDEAVAAGLARTVWPFAAGLALGWVAALAAGRERLRGTELVPTGACVWLGTLAGGMALRALSGQGVAASFVIVAAAVLAVFLFGWRAAYRISRR